MSNGTKPTRSRKPDEAKMKCRFCTSYATHTCTFKYPEPRIVLPGEIQELDIVRDDLTLIYWPVKEAVRTNGYTYATIKFAGQKRSVIQRLVNVRLPMLRMEIQPCGNQVCQNHIREFDEGMSQCAEHWTGFEKVYGH